MKLHRILLCFSGCSAVLSLVKKLVIREKDAKYYNKCRLMRLEVLLQAKQARVFPYKKQHRCAVLWVLVGMQTLSHWSSALQLPACPARVDLSHASAPLQTLRSHTQWLQTSAWERK